MVVAFLTIPGIKGSARQSHVLEQIAIQAVSAETIAVPDWKTGKPASEGLLSQSAGAGVKTRHKLMTLTKPIDRASAALYESMDSGSKFDGVVLAFWRLPPGGGGEQNYYRIKMDGVQIAGVRLAMPNNRVAGNEFFPEQEEVLLTYTHVEYVYDTTPPGSGNSGGTDPVEVANTSKLAVEFDVPLEAKAREAAVAGAKWAAKEAAGKVYELFKPEALKEAEKKAEGARKDG
jgi:type VI secretion system Hcp family effector